MREISIYKRYCYYCTTDFQNGASTTTEGGAEGSFRGASHASPQEWWGELFQLIAAPSYKGEKADGHHSPPRVACNNTFLPEKANLPQARGLGLARWG